MRRIIRTSICIKPVVAALGVALGLAVASFDAQAQGKYPDRPLRLIVPFGPGGGTDIIGRRFAARMTLVLGQSVVVDNRGGADGTIGSAEAARAKPDGYTVSMCTSSSHSIRPLIEKVSYDPVRDFAQVSLIGITPMGLAVHPIVAGSLPELVRRVKASPGKYSYGSTGMGGVVHLAGELFKRQAGGLDMVNVPYKGSGQSLQALIGGHIPTIIATLSTVEAHHREGRLRVVAVFNEERSATLPEVPTASEAGVPGVLAYTWTMLCAPAATPQTIVDHLHRASAKVLEVEGFRKELAALGIEPVAHSTPATARRFMQDEIARWAPIIEASGVRAQ